MVANVVEAIVKRGARDTAAKVLQHIGGVFRLAQARGLRDDNPSEPVHEVLPAKKQKGRMPAVLTFSALGQVLRGAEAAHLSPAVRMAHRLCAFTVARISNIVQAEWSEFHLESEVPTWVIPRKKMKSQDRPHDHKIVLCPAVAEELREWRSLGCRTGYLFPSPIGKKHITRESLEKAYRVTLELQDKHTPHGWRAAFSTLARDHGFDREVVELVLDHIHDNDVARAYDRGERLQQRVNLMHWWGEELSRAERGAEVVPIGFVRSE
jgi:integrase